VQICCPLDRHSKKTEVVLGLFATPPNITTVINASTAVFLIINLFFEGISATSY